MKRGGLVRVIPGIHSPGVDASSNLASAPTITSEEPVGYETNCSAECRGGGSFTRDVSRNVAGESGIRWESDIQSSVRPPVASESLQPIVVTTRIADARGVGEGLAGGGGAASVKRSLPASSLDARSIPRCPGCGSQRVWRDGMRFPMFGDPIQRWICRECGYRFSQGGVSKSLNSACGLPLSRQICVSLNGENSETKNLGTAQTIEKVCAGDGKLLTYAWFLKKKRGAADNTISMRVEALRRIQYKGVILDNPESFETVLATEPLTPATKSTWVRCYASYTKMMMIPWEPIRVKYEPKMPFDPTREEMNAIITAASKRYAAFLQAKLTTGARVGELCMLHWTDINAENCTISINYAEKDSRNRTVKVPQKTIVMLSALPKKSLFVFNTKPANVRVMLQTLRKRLARTQNNPRFLRIHLHTFRRFYAIETLKATRSKDHVQYCLGHKSIVNTERYLRGVQLGDEKYYSAVATTIDQIRKLAEDGWTYFQECNGVKIFRKPM